MPEIGRFISEDPWQGTIAEPTTMNPYPYVQNNPIKYVDPLGLRHMVQDGGSAGVAPRKSRRDILNTIRAEVQTKELDNNSSWNCSIVSEGPSNASSSTNSRVKDGVLGFAVALDDSLFGGYAIKASNVISEIRGVSELDKDSWMINPDFCLYYTSGSIANTIYGARKMASGLKSSASNSSQVLVNSTGSAAQNYSISGMGVLQSIDGARITINSINSAINGSNSSISPRGESNPNLEKVNEKYLEKKGIDAHELKKDIYGKKAKITEYDVYVDKNTGELYTQRKPQYNKKGEVPIPTGEYIK